MDWVIISVLPGQGEEVLRPLHFHEGQSVASAITGKPLSLVRSWINGPIRKLFCLTPLPCVKYCAGPIILHPSDSEAEELFAPLGDITAVSSAWESEVLRAISGLVAPTYALMARIVDWSMNQGTPERSAKEYTASLISGLCQSVRHAPQGRLNQLISDNTPGGYNEMTFRMLSEAGMFDQWTCALDAVLERQKNPDMD